MLFHSYLFVLCFLPLTVLLYYGANRVSHRLGGLVLLAASLVFYAWYNVKYLLLIAGSILVNYFFSKQLERAGRRKKLLLLVAVAANILLIAYYKYYNFFVENINSVFHASLRTHQILLPLGISFFTLQQISYLADAYAGETDNYSLSEYAQFVTFFPQLVAGPIVLHSELIPQFRDPARKAPQAEALCKGIMMFSLGLAKKMLIADHFAQSVDYVYANPQAAAAPELVLAILAFSLQLYFDFSGYSDMATGLASMFCLELPVNFNSPYRARSIDDAWKRWHMTLGRFFTKYVYLPLGGNRKGTGYTVRNIMIVFLISGLWHGANMTFVLWGFLNGAAVCLWRLGAKKWEKVPVFLQVPLTQMLFFFLLGLFRADSIAQFGRICGGIFAPRGFYLRDAFLETLRVPYLRTLLSATGISVTDRGSAMLSALLCFLFALVLCALPVNNYRREYRRTVPTLAGTVLLMLFCVLCMGQVSVFLYYDF